MSFSDALGIPLTVKVGGRDVTLRPPAIEDLGPWLAELTPKIRAAAKAQAESVPALADRRAAVARAELLSATPDDIIGEVFTAEGVTKMLDLLFTNAGVAKEALPETRRAVGGWWYQKRLAIAASGLLADDEVARMYAPRNGKEKPDPNRRQGEESGETSTGTSPPSSSAT